MWDYNTVIFGVILHVIYFSTPARADVDSMEPGQCLSRFDYDYKVMQKLSELESNIKDLKKTKDRGQGRSSIAFMAQLTTSISEPQVGATVVFNSVLTNDGGSYKTSTGVFDVKVDGTYSIQLTASSPVKLSSAILHLYIMKNSQQIGYVFLDQNTDYWLQRSAGVVIHMDTGDRVWVKFGQIKGSVVLAGCCFHTHFSGFLVHQD